MGLAAKKLRNARRSFDRLEETIAPFSFRSGVEEQLMMRKLPAAAPTVCAAAENYHETVASQTTRRAHAPVSNLSKLRVVPKFSVSTHHLQMTVCQQLNRVKLSSPTRNRSLSLLLA